MDNDELDYAASKLLDYLVILVKDVEDNGEVGQLILEKALAAYKDEMEFDDGR